MPKRTPQNCGLIKTAMKLGLGYPDGKNGKCQGYQIGEIDDEPCRECQQCDYFEGKCDDE